MQDTAGAHDPLPPVPPPCTVTTGSKGGRRRTLPKLPPAPPTHTSPQTAAGTAPPWQPSDANDVYITVGPELRAAAAAARNARSALTTGAEPASASAAASAWQGAGLAATGGASFQAHDDAGGDGGDGGDALQGGTEQDKAAFAAALDDFFGPEDGAADDATGEAEAGGAGSGPLAEAEACANDPLPALPPSTSAATATATGTGTSTATGTTTTATTISVTSMGVTAGASQASADPAGGSAMSHPRPAGDGSLHGSTAPLQPVGDGYDNALGGAHVQYSALVGATSQDADPLPPTPVREATLHEALYEDVNGGHQPYVSLHSAA